MTALVFIVCKPNDEAPSQEVGNKPSLCGFKSASFTNREISPNYQITYSQRKASVTSMLMIWQGSSCGDRPIVRL